MRAICHYAKLGTMKAKNKTVLLVGVMCMPFNDDVAEKTEKRIRETIGLSKKKFPILVYDKSRLDLELMDIPR